jgi:nucleoside-diphosphate-sugar epimerase
MNVFVAGATGAIGRPLLDRLQDEGYGVTALTRSQDSAAQLRGRGVRAVVADVFDRAAVHQAVIDARPEVVINQLTSIPQNLDMRRITQEFEATNRLRIQGTQILTAAAQAAGARRFIAQSFAPYYTPHGSGLASEDQALYLDGPSAFAGIVQAIVSLERTVLDAQGIEGVVLRYGLFYGPGTSYASDGSFAEAVRQRKMPIIAPGTAEFSFIHVDDAADATVLAMNKGEPGIYNIVDDEPTPLHEWLPEVADLLEAPQPMRIPKLLGQLVGGRAAMFFMNEQRGVSNRKAKEQLGWQPRHTSWRDGFRSELKQALEPSFA